MKKIASNLEFDRAMSGDEDAICHLLAMAFAFSRERAREYVGNVGIASFRMIRDPVRTAKACAAVLMTSHSIGGVDVPAANIAHVAIAPEARGQRLARPVVDALCEDAREQGALMVSLFASARPVYRKCGFELAGSEIVYEADTAALPVRTPVEFVALALSDDNIASAYAAKRRGEAGLLGRADMHWKELLRAPTNALAAYGAARKSKAGTMDAYVILDGSDPDVLHIRDWYAANGEMAEAVLCFVGRFRSVYPKVRWHGGPEDDLVAAMPDKGWRLLHQEEWLARILESAQALECRGYVLRNASLGLCITEMDASDLELSLELSDRTMRVSRGVRDGLPTVTVDGPFFSSLFTGFSSASQLARRGRLSGSPEAVSLCDLVFTGPKPWVAEHF
jgi:predicted acetyltransferase